MKTNRTTDKGCDEEDRICRSPESRRLVKAGEDGYRIYGFRAGNPMRVQKIVHEVGVSRICRVKA